MEFYMINEVMVLEKRAVVSVVGKDQVVIIGKVTEILSENNINILAISQTSLQEFFTMMMIVDVSKNEDLEQLEKQFDGVRQEMTLQIHIQLEEIFKTMHRV